MKKIIIFLVYLSLPVKFLDILAHVAVLFWKKHFVNYKTKIPILSASRPLNECIKSEYFCACAKLVSAGLPWLCLYNITVN